MQIKDFFNKHPVFRYEEFSNFMKNNGTNLNSSIRQLLSYYHKQGKIISIRRLLYAVNPETISAGQEIDPYLVAAKATQSAILGYHTALEIHNLAYTTFEELTYLTASPSKGFSFQKQYYRPICYPSALAARKKWLFGVYVIKRYGIDIKVTSLERTLVDILDRPDLSGGWEEVIRSIGHVVSFDAKKIIDYVILLNKASIAAKVGYFFELLLPKHLMLTRKHSDKLLERIPKQPYYLETSQKGKGQGIYIKKWQLIVPRYVAEQRWEEPNANI